MAEMVETLEFESRSSRRSRRDELARGIHDALKARHERSIARDGDGAATCGAGDRNDRAASPGNWDDEFTFIHAEEPDDAAWDFDDSVDAGRSSSRVVTELPASNGSKPLSDAAEPPDAHESPVQTPSEPVSGDVRPKHASSSAKGSAPSEARVMDGPGDDTDELGQFLARQSMDWQYEEPESEELEPDSELWEFDTPDADWSQSGWPEGEDHESGAGDHAYEPLLNYGEFADVPLEAFQADRDEEELNWSRSHWIEHEEYSRAIAVDIARSVGWSEAGMEVIAWAIRPYRAFGRVRADLKSFIRNDRVTVRELRLVTELRSAWVDGGYNRGWVYTRNHFGTRAVDCKINLDWWLALKMYRVLGADDVEEVRLFLDHCFEAWTEISAAVADIDLCLMDPASPEKQAALHFHAYLHFVLDRMEKTDGERRLPPFIDPHLFPREEGIRDCDTDRLDPLTELFGHE